MDLKFAFKSECGWASTPDKGKCKIPKRPAARQMLILYNKLELKYIYKNINSIDILLIAIGVINIFGALVHCYCGKLASIWRETNKNGPPSMSIRHICTHDFYLYSVLVSFPS